MKLRRGDSSEENRSTKEFSGVSRLTRKQQDVQNIPWNKIRLLTTCSLVVEFVARFFHFSFFFTNQNE